MNNQLGIHWIREHPDNQRDLDFMRRVQPASVKLFQPAWSNRDFCDALRGALPADCIILARDHELSEQKEDMWRDPAGTGRRHANEWRDKARGGGYHMPLERSYFLGINEPDATNGDRAAINAYTIALLDTLRSHGLRGGAFNFSTGHPRTVDGTGNTAADYSVFEGSRQAIVRGGHLAVLHIYGSAAEPCVPGHFDRLRACTWQDVQWVVGECGIDEHVVTGGEHRGYLAALNPPTSYPQWLERLIRGTDDSRIHSWQPFTFDFSHPWASFDARQVNDAFVAWGWRGMEGAAAPAPAPEPIHLPIVENGGSVSQPDGIIDPLVLEAILAIESGGSGLREGRVVIRFEPHIFRQQLGDDATFATLFRYGSPAWTGREFYADGRWQSMETGGQPMQWRAYELAASVRPEAAARSMSMGAAQIMGFNHARVGYPSARAMLHAFRSEPVQVIALINFLLSDSALWRAVQARNWREVARRYNGPGQVDYYAALLEGKYNELLARG